MQRPSFIATTLLALAALITLPSLAEAQSRPVRLVVLGDSLSSGFLIPRSQAFPAALEGALRQRGYDVAVGDAAVSGNTSLQALARVDRDVPDGTDGVIIQLGANDVLRRQPPANLQANLEQIVLRLRARGIKVMLAGFSYVPADADSATYNAAFRAVAGRYGLPLYPNFYDGLSSNYRIFDNRHPSPAGVQVIVARTFPTVTRFVAGLGGRPASRR